MHILAIFNRKHVKCMFYGLIVYFSSDGWREEKTENYYLSKNKHGGTYLIYFIVGAIVV